MPGRLIKRVLVVALASVVILAGLLVGGVRLIDHFMPAYRNALAERIGNRIDADIDIDGVDLRWGWRGPVLQLRKVSLTRHGESQPAVTMASLGLAFSYRDLFNGRRLPDGLTIDTPQLALAIGPDHRPKVVHWSRADDTPLGWDAVQNARELLRRVHIANATLEIRSPRLPDGRARLDPVDIRWQDEAGQLTFEASADGPDWFEHVRASGRFTGALPDLASGDAVVNLDHIDIPALAGADGRLDPDVIRRLAGANLSTQINAVVADHRIARIDADMSLSALTDTSQAPPLIPAVTATLKAARPAPTADTDDELRFAFTELVSDSPALADTRISGALDFDAPSLQLDARHPPADIAWRLARLFEPKLASTRIDTDIDNLRLVAAGGAPLQLGFDFSDLTIDNDQLSAGPLAGSYYQGAGHHELAMRNAGGTLSIKHYLRGALAIDDLDGAISWRRDGDGWQIDARQLRVATGEASVQARGEVRVPAAGAPVVDIHATAQAPDVVRLLQRIPQAENLPNQRLRDWLGKAITAGHLDSAELDISGPLDRFPFEKPAPGERFHLKLAGNGVDVDYKPGWPQLEDARGTLSLDGDDLRVQVSAARMLGVAVGPAKATVANVREPVLMLNGGARRAPAEDMLQFLVESPLRDKFQSFVEAVDITGPADLALDLRIPLKSGLGDFTFKGAITAHGNTLRQQVLPGPITDITGKLNFDERGLVGPGLEGQLLGVALRTDLSALPDRSQRIVTDATLNLPRDAKAIAHYLPESWLGYATGATDIRVAFDIARSGQISPVTLTSDTAGMRVDLPSPLTKPAATPAPLQITVAADARTIDIRYDKRLDVAVALTDGRPRRIQAVLDDPGVTPPDRDGVWIGGQTDALDGIGWFSVVREQLNAAASASQNSGDSTASSLAFIGGDMRAAKLNLDNRYFEQAHIRAQPTAASPGWRIDFEGPNTQGQVVWSQLADGHVGIAGNLARLALKTRPPASTPPVIDDSSVIWPNIAPDQLPSLDINVSQVQVDATDFGHASVQASILPSGWQLDRFQLADGALTGWATGQWIHDGNSTRANAETRLEGHGLADLMRILGYTPTLQARTANVHAKLIVNPNAQGLDLNALDGQVSLALDDGTLLSVEPGAGRVLGLTNLYVLPRRLRLDFRDVVDKGLAFDSLNGEFNIDSGNAYTDGLTIETPSSEIAMTGRIGLAARDYDERVTIMPKLGSSVAIASGVLGGPIVGAAVFAFQEMFKEPLQKFSSIAYTLKGSWDEPEFSDPSAQRKTDP